MAEIRSANDKFNGISASVSFVNGVGNTDVPHLISWFKENGYTVVEDEKANSQESETAQESEEKNTRSRKR